MEFKQGDVILSSEPYTWVLTHKERQKRCDFCFESEDLQRCSECQAVKYCNRKCQKSGWGAHKLECKCLTRVFPDVPTESARLLFRLLCKGLIGSHSKKDSTGLRCFDDLMNNVQEISKDAAKMDNIHQLWMTINAFVGEEFPLPSQNDFTQLCGKVFTNSFTICDGELQDIGVGIYRSPSILDHSCKPNAVVIFTGTKLELRALHNISLPSMDKIGQYVFISYIDQLSTTSQRQDALRSQYYFNCSCDMCLDYDRDSLLQLTLGSDNFPDSDQLDKSNYNDPRLYLEKCEACLKEQAGTLGELNVHRVKTLDKAFDAAIDVCEWKKALDYGKATITPYRQLYPSPHPAVGIQLMKIGKIQLYMNQIEEALDSLKQAEKILKITHGEEHPLYDNLLGLLDSCYYKDEL